VELARDGSDDMEAAVPSSIVVGRDRSPATALVVARTYHQVARWRAVLEVHAPKSRDEVGVGGGWRCLKVLEAERDVNRRAPDFSGADPNVTSVMSRLSMLSMFWPNPPG